MLEKPVTISSLIEDSHQTAIEKGWWDTLDKVRNFGEQLMLMVTELSEVMEDYRIHGIDEHSLLRIENGKPEGIAAEFADVLIRLTDTCGRYNIPLEEALILKAEYNRHRPYRHGGKLA
ncbi:MAG: hypothetical protein WC315_00110 [Candidatus Omnitrophota bacterium]|jgi:NTP pyrophosphatase (non-canonical NTP hydrolase)